MTNPIDELKQLVYNICSLTEEEWIAFSTPWKQIELSRKELITETGQTERYLYFVVSGLQRVYFQTESKEATLVFTYAPSFGGVIDSLMLQTPSKFCYETLTPSVLLKISYEEIERLSRQFPAIQTMLNKGLSFAISGVLDRLAELQCYSSEEKFRALLSRSPHILQLVPHKYLANYIGIDVTNFSKLINRIKI